MTATPDDGPIDLTAVRADDALVEQLRAGDTPGDVDPTHATLNKMLGGYVAEVRDGTT